MRDGSLAPARYVADACDRLDAFDGTTRAVLPEEGRRARLLDEAAALAGRYRDPATRPPLYGVLAGVKDIIAVDGMAPRCGWRRSR